MKNRHGINCAKDALVDTICDGLFYNLKQNFYDWEYQGGDLDMRSLPNKVRVWGDKIDIVFKVKNGNIKKYRISVKEVRK